MFPHCRVAASSRSLRPADLSPGTATLDHADVTRADDLCPGTFVGHAIFQEEIHVREDDEYIIAPESLRTWLRLPLAVARLIQEWHVTRVAVVWRRRPLHDDVARQPEVLDQPVRRNPRHEVIRAMRPPPPVELQRKGEASPEFIRVGWGKGWEVCHAVTVGQLWEQVKNVIGAR
jgi:hypothetical protein